LFVIGTERHEARRIDDQLRGRAGRQGDAGASRFFVSLKDDLMRIFGSERIQSILTTLKMPEDQPIENGIISKAIESAQAKIEGFNFDSRKHVLEYDDVMNKQRETIYKRRKELLEPTTDLKVMILNMVAQEIEKIAGFHTAGRPDEWNRKEIVETFFAIFPMPQDAPEKINSFSSPEEIIEYAIDISKTAYEAKEKELGLEATRQIEKVILLRSLDTIWMDHLDEMEHLRDSVKLRAYGQKDPLVEYKNEGHKMFQGLFGVIQTNVVTVIYKVGIMKEPKLPEKVIEMGPAKTLGNSSVAPTKKEPGRNDPCPCGSGKKYKKCHGQ
ncbi:MAG: preprotein translocase subunit SecA, partial [Candidatus Portnoybacteria bacterium CG10_big_fil_rev_8_21_14_0_10_36_7]